MITVKEATQIVLSHLSDWGTRLVPLQEAIGKISAEPLSADRDFPPFTRVAMDGIAIRYEAFAAGRRSFVIKGMQTAGSPQLSLDDPEGCLEVMTGSMLPLGTDTVIRYEDTKTENGAATITIENIQQGQNAHQQGLDRQAGDQIVPEGRKLSAAEVGIAATVGKTRIQVKNDPKVLLLSTGDELVEVDQQPLPHQIRKSNVYTLQAALRNAGIPANQQHLPDDRAAILITLEKAIRDYDVLILSGGVSKGKRDYIPEVLNELQVEKHFHRVRQRPGKPFWFGSHASGTVVFALPGNPVSTFMCLHRYFFPWWRQCLGIVPKKVSRAVLGENFAFRPDLSYFLQVRLEQNTAGVVYAYPVKGKGSGDLANLVDADGFLELPNDRTEFSAGETYPLWTYR